MFADNIFLQVISLICLTAVGLLLAATFIPALRFEDDVSYPNVFRGVLLIFVFGLLRGAL